MLEQFRNGKNITGKYGLLTPLIKQLTEAALEAEVESHIANGALQGVSWEMKHYRASITEHYLGK